ncbi:MAG: hypothetical protein J6I76_00925 [Oribacterium sp.]|nr:hypothetical protein [Oribacterium sp.]MBP3802451.1 hypothetical protein [Oribacterium sp.]
MKINKKWIKRGLACIGVAGVGIVWYYLGSKGKIDMDTAFTIGESGWLGGTQDALDMLPLDKEITFTKDMYHEILDKLDENVKLIIKDDCIIRRFPDGFTLRTF